MVNRSPVNEDSILRQIRNWCHSTHIDSTVFGVGDDAACIQPSGRSILFCSDMTIQGEHFDLEFSTPADVGHKSLARVLSDLAAMGAKPLALTISIALPKDWSADSIERFLENYFAGATSISKTFQAPIAGGDLTRLDGPIVIDVAAIGETYPQARPWRRAGAFPNDLVYVTGTVGTAAYALSEMKAGNISQLAPEIAIRHQRPLPRLDVAKRFASFPIRAAIDISDGLLRDALRLCTESNVSIAINEDQIPATTATSDRSKQLGLTLHGGDDYELLLVVPAEWAESSIGASELHAVGATRIGRVEVSSKPGNAEVFLTNENGNRRLAASASHPPAGHDPFRDN